MNDLAGVRVVEYRVQHGADVNKANKAGWTPLMTAARMGNRNIIQLLPDSEADIVVWMTMLQGDTAIDRTTLKRTIKRGPAGYRLHI